MLNKVRSLIKAPSIFIWFLRDLVDKYGRPVLSLLMILLACARLVSGSEDKYLMTLMDAHRISDGKSKLAMRLLLKNKAAAISVSRDYIDARAYERRDIEIALRRVIILKKALIKNGTMFEKGLILLKFTNTFGVLYQNFDFSRISKEYHLVLEPSWAGYCLPEILVWAELKEPVIVQATEPLDFEFVKLFSENLHPVSIGSSNWVDDSFFYPIPEELKLYDVLYVANYNRIKRHHVFFKAIAKARSQDPGFRAAMACGAAGANKSLVYSLIDYYDIDDCLDVFENLSKIELNVLINKSNCNILLSLKEGSNRSLFESMFSNVPAILNCNNVGVNKSYINSATGSVCNDRDLAKAIFDIRNNIKMYSPASWAKQNISPEVSTDHLVSLIRGLEGNPEWGKGDEVLVKVNRPEAKYKNRAPQDSGYDAMKVLKAYRYSHSYQHEFM